MTTTTTTTITTTTITRTEPEATPLQILAERRGQRLTVEVMLLNKRTRKVAVWLADETRFMEDMAPHDPPEAAIVGRDQSIVMDGVAFRHGE